MTRNFIFTSYMVICLLSVLSLVFVDSLVGKEEFISTNKALLFVGFYGFFCTTCSFVLIDRINSKHDEQTENAEKTQEVIWRQFDYSRNELQETHSQLQRELDAVRDDVHEGKLGYCNEYPKNVCTNKTTKK